MKKESNLKLFTVSLVMLGCSIGFASCSKDDDKTKEPTSDAVYGEYAGKMYVTAISPQMAAAADDPQTSGLDINATVKSDTVFFEDFPVQMIVASMVPAEMLDAIMGAIGKVQYKIGYKAALNETKDGFVLEADPKPLELTIPLSATEIQFVKVTVSATDKGDYSVGNKNLKFSIKANSVTVNETPLPGFSELPFSFDLNKK
ncbi:MAG: DUF4840 domain-containing protein [Tannerella sp.]|jgi:hypothetical protein|nr:DUF4840 domain-containing protein [Tannerella sp.]